MGEERIRKSEGWQTNHEWCSGVKDRPEATLTEAACVCSERTIASPIRRFMAHGTGIAPHGAVGPVTSLGPICVSAGLDMVPGPSRIPSSCGWIFDADPLLGSKRSVWIAIGGVFLPWSCLFYSVFLKEPVDGNKYEYCPVILYQKQQNGAFFNIYIRLLVLPSINVDY